MSDVSQWSDFKRQVVPHRVVFTFYLSAPEPFEPEGDGADGANETQEQDEGRRPLYTLYLTILQAVFEGWCPPIPQPDDPITFTFDRADGDAHTGTVTRVDCSYGSEGVTYEILVHNNTDVSPLSPALPEDGS